VAAGRASAARWDTGCNGEGGLEAPGGARAPLHGGAPLGPSRLVALMRNLHTLSSRASSQGHDRSKGVKRGIWSLDRAMTLVTRRLRYAVVRGQRAHGFLVVGSGKGG
jgi:hypothetical protein